MSENHLVDILHRIEKIEQRNLRVQAEKSWETSHYRKILVLISTYIIMTITMYSIGIKDFYIQAIIPTLGYFLSTLSFGFIKAKYIKKFIK